MADRPEEKASKATIEARLAGKLPILIQLPQGMQAQHLESCAKQALPRGSQTELDEFVRYWREQLNREREHWDRERQLKMLQGLQETLLDNNPMRALASDATGATAEPIARLSKDAFNKLVPEAESRGAEGTGVARGQSANLPQSNGQGQKRGPKTDYENALRVADIVARIAPDGAWHSKLDKICDALDNENIPSPSKWRRDEQCQKWGDYPERAKAIKVIAYRLKVATQRKKGASETLS